ncbi:MAG: RdgB/HAM1 family non-canonical purine NTP pyrophosphatase [Planctomyces sp.]
MTLQAMILSSRNRKKTQEVAEILAPVGIQIVSVTEFAHVGEVEEDGVTFAENAAKKATQVARELNQWVIGEDSGLMVDALNGAPGIYSARYSGPSATDELNNRKLLAELEGVPDERRGAGYICSVAVSNPSGEVVAAVEGTCRGRILRTAVGTGGFGYDPYFLIPEYHQTFGALSSVVKHRLSHRARAFAKLIPILKTIIASHRD